MPGPESTTRLYQPRTPAPPAKASATSVLRADNSAPIRIIRDRMLFLFGLLPALDELSGHQKVPSSERIELNRHTRLTERSVALLAPRPAQVPKFG